MKNLILATCLLASGSLFSQDFLRGQIFESFDNSTDSIAIYKVSDTVYNNFFRFVRAHKLRKHETFDDSKIVNSIGANTLRQTFSNEGIYAIQCYKDGEPLKPTFLQVDERYARANHLVVKVGHSRYHYYYIQ